MFKKRINLLAIILIVIPIFIYNYQYNFKTDLMTNGDFHFYYVVFSSAIAFFVGIASYFEYKKNKIEKIFYISIGFLGVGVIYTFHALVTPTMTIIQPFEFSSVVNNISIFVLFGDLSRLWLALMMFIPDNFFEENEKVKKYFNGYTIAIFLVILTGSLYYGLLNPEIFPVFKNEDLTDTYIAILTKVATVIFLGINALRYYYSYKAKPNITILSFIIGLVFIMEAAIIFMISIPWSSNWWLAHNLFLSSYIVIGLGVLYSFFSQEKYEYFDVIGQINKYTKLLEEKNIKLDTMANYDALTGLSNRRHFTITTEECINESKKNNSTFGLIFIDLDLFKTINDKYGHKIGDELLKIVSERIKSIIKPKDIASRVGGDEFVLLLKDVNQTQIESIANRILDKFEEPIIINENVCNVGLSIGISIYPNNGNTIDELITKSDEAMYKAKKAGGNNFKTA